VPLATDASIVAKGSDPAAASSIAKNDECTPRDHDAERYRERRRTFQRLYTQLEPLFDEISGYRE
jgi:sugar (pentulose or hexulose) kinase